VILSAQNTTHLGARAGGVAPMRDNDSNTNGSPLQRLVTLDLRKVTLDEALAEIDRQATLGLSYSPRTVPVDRIVTIRVTNMPASQALDVALKGTNVRVTVGATGQIVLVRDVVVEDSTTGAVEGTVLETSTRALVTGATVQISGSKIAQSTKNDGSFHLLSVPAGAHVVRVTRLGYEPRELNVFVTGGKSAKLVVNLTPVSIHLNDVITTATGSQKRLELGNSIATINADSVVRNAPVKNLADLLAARAPGVEVLSTSGSLGAGSRIRVRGLGRVSGNSDPIVIVDGVRMDANYSDYAGGAGTDTKQFNQAAPSSVRSAASSRLDDIDPNSIETIEVLKGPSAATLYGSDAANGVIVIKTKSGRAGPARWAFTADRGMMQMKAKFAEQYQAWGESPVYGSGAACSLQDLVSGACTRIDSVTHFSPLNDSYTTPFTDGRTTTMNAQVSGGTDQMLYFFSGSGTGATGVLTMPKADMALLKQQNNNSPIPDWQMHPNTFSKQSGQARMTSNFGGTGNISFTALATHQLQANMGDNEVVGAALQGSGSKGVNDGWASGSTSPRPATLFAGQGTSAETRGTVSLNGNWTPSTWFNGRATVGGDYGDRTDNYLAQRGTIVYNAPNTLGQRGRVENNTTVYSADFGGTVTIPAGDLWKFQTAAGASGQHTYNKLISGNGSNIPPGATTFNSAQTTTLFESFDQNVTASWFIQEMANFRDRLFLTGALQQTAGSSFGDNVEAPVYPKLSLSWLVSQEPFFPQFSALSSVRFRFAYGHAGQQPSTTGALRTFSAQSAFLNGQVVPVATLNSLGNSLLKPERGTEFEGGADLSLFEDRLTIEGTFYRKVTKDALVAPQVPPSFGYPLVLPVQQNVGTVLNTGVEWTINGTPITTTPFTWDFTIGISGNKNRLTKLNDGVFLSNNGQEAYVVGYPLSGVWTRPILGYRDANGDGIISPNEVAIGDSIQYIGSGVPTHEVSWTNTVGFWNNRFRVTAMLDYQGGLGQYDQGSASASQHSRAWMDPSASLESQALVQAYWKFPNNSAWGYDASVSFTRLRELTFSYDLPASWAQKIRASSATLLLMGENLRLWSSYTGADPEVNVNPIRNYYYDSGGMPLTRNWTLRLNLGL